MTVASFFRISLCLFSLVAIESGCASESECETIAKASCAEQAGMKLDDFDMDVCVARMMWAGMFAAWSEGVFACRDEPCDRWAEFACKTEATREADGRGEMSLEVCKGDVLRWCRAKISR